MFTSALISVVALIGSSVRLFGCGVSKYGTISYSSIETLP